MSRGGNEKTLAWVKQAGAGASQGSFADAASFGELVFNCTNAHASLDALQAAGAANLRGKILVDLANPLDFSNGMPTLFVGNDDSRGERIPARLSRRESGKSLNTVNCDVMVETGKLKGDSDIFVSGNDAAAKGRVSEILRSRFGWKSVVDLGDLTSARGVETWLLLWAHVYGALGSHNFNLKLVRD